MSRLLPTILRTFFAISALLLVGAVLFVHDDTPRTTAQIPWTSGHIKFELAMDPVAFVDEVAPLTQRDCWVNETGIDADPSCLAYGFEGASAGFIMEYNNNTPVRVQCTNPPADPANPICLGDIARYEEGPGVYEPMAVARSVATGVTGGFSALAAGETGEYYLTMRMKYEDPPQDGEQLDVYLCDTTGPIVYGDEASACTKLDTADDLGSGWHTCTFPDPATIGPNHIIIFTSAAPDEANTNGVALDWYSFGEVPPYGTESCITGQPVGAATVENLQGWGWFGTNEGQTDNTVGWVNLNCQNMYYDPVAGTSSFETRCATDGYTDFGLQAYWGNADPGIIPICGEAWIGDGDPSAVLGGATCADDDTVCRSSGWMTTDPTITGTTPDGTIFDATIGTVDVFEAGTGDMRALFNTGGSAFDVGFSSTYFDMRDVLAVDLTGDRYLDLVIAAGTNGGVDLPTLHVPNTGSGTYPGVIEILGFPWEATNAIAAGDFTGDGSPEVIEANEEQEQLVDSSTTLWAGTTSDDSRDVAVADFDHDGHLDFVVANEGTASRVYFGDGTGQFPVAGDLTDGGIHGRAVATGFFDTDAYEDIVLLSTDPKELVLLINPGTGVQSAPFTAFTQSIDDTVSEYASMAVGQFNVDADGYLDIVVGGQPGSGDAAFVYLSNGAPGLFTEVALPSAPATTRANGVAVGDLDRDGAQDIVVANAGAGASDWNVVYYGNGSGAFSAPTYLVVSGETPIATTTLSLGDLDAAGSGVEPPRQCTAALFVQDRGPYRAGQVIGWARVRSLQEHGEELSSDSDDWGWVKFNGDWCATPNDPDGCVNYSIASQSFSGYAWAGGGTEPGGAAFDHRMGYGWLDFSYGTFTEPYLLTQSGDVYTQEDIIGGIPEGFSQFGATYLIQAGGTIQNFPSGSGNDDTPEFEFPGYDLIDFPGYTEQFANVLGQINYDEIVSRPPGTERIDIANAGDLPDDGALNGLIYFRDGPLTIPAAGLTFTNAIADQGSGLIVVNGDLTINGDITYDESITITNVRQLASLGWIVKGDVIIDGSVQEIAGAFVTLGSDDGVSPGTFATSPPSQPSSNALVVKGLVLARAFDFNRTYIGTPGNPQPAETFIYDGRVFANAPPGMEDLTRAIPEFRLITP